jgi:glycosyltransferase involved in cell wall biosynthesis
MRKLSVLLTNNTLDARAGSELYVRDVALALLRRGHHPIAFSLVLGPVAEELRRATVPVIDDLARLGSPPDVIHGHHHLETLVAALMFPGVPIVHFCHGWVPWEELPLEHPSIRKYVAVDDVCLDRLVREEGIPPARVERVLNFVDLERFRQRPPLPAKPARALVLSNAATQDGYTRLIAAACAASGTTLDIVGAGNGNPADAPEELLWSYDLVFAKARAALEAMATGCAVVLADWAGCGPLVTPANFDMLRVRNFGVRELQRPHEAAWYASQIAAYDPAAAAEVCRRVRAEADLESAISRLLTIYEGAIADPPQVTGSSRAAAQHLQRVLLRFKQTHTLSRQLQEVRAELEVMRRELDTRTRTDVEAVPDARALERELRAYKTLTTVRLRDAVLRVPVVGPAAQAVARAAAKLLRR